MDEELHRREFDRIKSLSNEELLAEFEKDSRCGAGKHYIYYVWKRNEILNRLNR